VGAGAVVIADVPTSCTVVGIPGRVVVREGQRVDVVDLHHEDLPDPVVEMYRSMTRRIERLETRLARDEDMSAEAGTTVFGEAQAPREDDDDDPRL
jgi:serine O-acetyltransferase